MRARASRGRGFFLIEVILAILILGIGIAGVLEAITQCLRANRDAAEMTTAVELATSRMELLRTELYLDAGSSEGEFPEPFAAYSWTETLEMSEIEGLYDVAVEIRHQPSGKTIYRLDSRLYDPPLAQTGSAAGGAEDPEATADPRRRRLESQRRRR